MSDGIDCAFGQMKTPENGEPTFEKLSTRTENIVIYLFFSRVTVSDF